MVKCILYLLCVDFDHVIFYFLKVRTVADLNAIHRFVEPPIRGPLCDILWADPQRVHQLSSPQRTSNDNDDGSGSSNKSDKVDGKEKPGDGDTTDDDDSRSKHWRPNEARGCSFFFSEAAARRFLRRNGLLCLVRAHEVQELGYQAHFLRAQQEVEAGTSAITEEKEESQVNCNDDENVNDGNTPSPGFGFSGSSLAPVITVFSAPNYCGRYGNRAALLQLGHGEPPPPVLASSSRDNVGSKDDVTTKKKAPDSSTTDSGSGTSSNNYDTPTRRPPIPTNFNADHGEIRWRTFDAVEEPEPLEDHSHTSNPMDTIRTNCPYMPLTFPELLKCAKEIGPATSFSQGGNSSAHLRSSKTAASQGDKFNSHSSNTISAAAAEAEANASAASAVAKIAAKHQGRTRVASSPPALLKPAQRSAGGEAAAALAVVDETGAAAFAEAPLTESAALLRSVGLEAFASTFELAGVTPKDWALVRQIYDYV